MNAVTTPQPPAHADHLLGHAANEQRRLIDQARFIGDLTTQLFERAGLRPGMRVLDRGCGVGDVSLLAASMVGLGGDVVGVDQSPQAIETARARAAQAGAGNVRFVCADLARVELDSPVDAIVGRLVLLYFNDPAALLRHLVRQARPGALVVFQEIDMEAVKSEPRCALLDLTTERIRQCFVRSGLDLRTGLHLGLIFERAGLPAPQMIGAACAACVERGADAAAYAYAADTARTLLPVMERTGVASAADVGIDTLEARLRAEALACDATVVSRPTSAPGHGVDRVEVTPTPVPSRAFAHNPGVPVMKPASTLLKPFALSLSLALGSAGLAAAGGLKKTTRFEMVRNGAAVSTGCVPDARAEVRIRSLGPVEVMDVQLEGLPPDTGFDLFVIQVPNPPFGMSWYQGDIETNRKGRAHERFVGRFSAETFIIAPGAAVAPRVHGVDAQSNPVTAPVHTAHLGLWFNSPEDAAKAGCLAITTPFNGEHDAGVQLLNTSNFADDHGPLLDVTAGP